MEIIIRIHVKILKKGANTPLSGDKYSVRFYDKDPLRDDYLGESSLDTNGHAIVAITRSNYRSKDSPLEKYPDIYFTVQKNGDVFYKSPVCQNVHVEERSDFSISGGMHCNLGTFIV